MSEDPDSVVCVISGHTREELEDSFPFDEIPRICIAGEKGAYFKWPDATEWVQSDKLGDVQEWKTIALKILQQYTDRTDGSFIDEKTTALVWHYHDADPEYGDTQAVELERYLLKMLEPHGIQIQRYDHARLLEVLPKDIHKGSAALTAIEYALMGVTPEERKNTFVLACGNDRSDEKMFAAVEEAGKVIHTDHIFTVSIGIKPTQAKFYLSDQKEIGWMLGILNAALYHLCADNKKLYTPHSNDHFLHRSQSEAYFGKFGHFLFLFLFLFLCVCVYVCVLCLWGLC